MIKSKRAQSIVEYMILMTAVILVILAFVYKGPFRKAIDDSFDSMIDIIENLEQ
ncbi:MAG: hypothetical protein ABIJ41_00090 [Candidatus Omnitrophota bacterium]